MENRKLSDEWEDWDGKTEEIKEGKRLFLGFLILELFLVYFSFIFILFLASPRLAQVSSDLPLAVHLLFLFFLASFILRLLFSIFLKRSLIFRAEKRALTYFFLPLGLKIFSIPGISKDRLIHSFLKVNNALTFGLAKKIPKEKIFLLFPHCLQRDGCSSQVVKDVLNCKRCGKCDMAEIAKIKEETGCEAVVVTGGTLARRLVKEKAPSLIITSACERELAAGLLEVSHIPIIAISNKRPEGPCKNTRVDTEEIRKAIEAFQEK